MYDDLYDDLVAALDSWTSARVIAPGRIEVTLPGPGDRRVVVVMTPDEWEDLAGVMWGSFDDAVADVQRSLLRLRPHEGFAVYGQYRLEPSTTDSLAARPRPPAGSGSWVAVDREGRVVSRLADSSDQNGPR
jgi:hypothetical protein